MSYTLLGRDIQAATERLSQEERRTRAIPSVPCIFCGEIISHLNDGGVGWCLGAMVDGKELSYLYCNQPPCEAAEKFEHLIWRCGCECDYVEMVGEFCTSCHRPRRDALPWEFDLDLEPHRTSHLHVASVRAHVLAEVYTLLPDSQLQLNREVAYVGPILTIASTGGIIQFPCRDNPQFDHISKLPLEALVDLRQILQSYWKDNHVSPPRRSRPEPETSRHRLRRAGRK